MCRCILSLFLKFCFGSFVISQLVYLLVLPRQDLGWFELYKSTHAYQKTKKKRSNLIPTEVFTPDFLCLRKWKTSWANNDVIMDLMAGDERLLLLQNNTKQKGLKSIRQNLRNNLVIKPTKTYRAKVSHRFRTSNLRDKSNIRVIHLIQWLFTKKEEEINATFCKWLFTTQKKKTVCK